jgi:hypothetical protein
MELDRPSDVRRSRATGLESNAHKNGFKNKNKSDAHSLHRRTIGMTNGWVRY